MSCSSTAFAATEISPSQNALDHRTRYGLYGFLLLGVIARFVRYLLCFPLCNDETALAENFLDRDYLGLMQPLANNQVAPLFFIWTELAISRIAGFSEYSLRWFPLICGTASLFLFYQLAKQLLPRLPLLFSVGVFSVSYYPIRHSCEVKPYAVDTFFTLLLLSLATTYWRTGNVKWLWSLVACIPLALGYSFPAVFVLGGISLAQLSRSFLNGSNHERIAFVAYNVVLVSVFLVLFVLFTNTNYETQFDNIMGDYWAEGFVPISKPLTIPWWLLNALSSQVLPYPLGGDNGGSTLALLGFLVGSAWLWKQGQTRWVTLTAGVFCLALVASAMQRYPFGGHPRLMQYLAPLACLNIGTGFAVLLSRVSDRRHRNRLEMIISGVLATIAVVVVIQDLKQPYRKIRYVRHRHFADRLWNQAAQQEPVYCLMRGSSLSPAWSSYSYRCPQQIATRGEFSTLPEVDHLDPQRTYQAVIWYQDQQKKRDYPKWRDQLTEKFEILSERQYPMESLDQMAYYEVLRLRLRPDARPAFQSAQSHQKSQRQ